MKFKDEIERVQNKLLQVVGNSGVKIRKIKIYINGLYGKFENAEYALDKIKEITQETGTYSAYKPEIDPEIHFYVDSFFAFLYSCFDVLAQILNQYYEELNRLNFKEKQISFKRILYEIKDNQLNLPVNAEFEKVVSSRYFRNLDKYRNCSTHKHQIYIERQQTTVSVTSGYTFTGELPTIQWIICDDPLKLKPSIKQRRDLYNFSKRMYDNIKEKIENIINVI